MENTNVCNIQGWCTNTSKAPLMLNIWVEVPYLYLKMSFISQPFEVKAPENDRVLFSYSHHFIFFLTCERERDK